MKPSIPKGTRDFTPEQVSKRNFIFDTIKKVFIKYGYQPIETPVMENLSTLTGKYGEEGDKLLFKVLNNGDFLKKADKQAIADGNSPKLIPSISKRGLRYDLTVPFARFVVMHQNDISFPFKRYQIQPVWRADRPQKGRYQEFYQCDVDVVGSDSLMYEAELVQIYDEVFATLGVNTEIKVNNRKILEGIAEAAGIADQFMDMTIAIDKLDKIGIEGVRKELIGRGIQEAAIDKIEKMLGVTSLTPLKELFVNSPTGLKGIEELEEFQDVKMGSIGGGGRYDDLTGNFGLKNVSGVGVSFGAARIFDVMEELDLFPKERGDSLKLLFVAFDDAAHKYAFNCLNEVRAAGINADLYPSPAKMKKQMKYANDRKVPFVAVIGSNEMEAGKVQLKNMETGEQSLLTVEEVIEQLF